MKQVMACRKQWFIYSLTRPAFTQGQLVGFSPTLRLQASRWHTNKNGETALFFFFLGQYFLLFKCCSGKHWGKYSNTLDIMYSVSGVCVESVFGTVQTGCVKRFPIKVLFMYYLCVCHWCDAADWQLWHWGFWNVAVLDSLGHINLIHFHLFFRLQSSNFLIVRMCTQTAGNRLHFNHIYLQAIFLQFKKDPKKVSLNSVKPEAEKLCC